MNSKNKYFEKVYNYFEGEISENEKLEFLKELEYNTELRAEYEAQKSLNKFLNNKNILPLQDKLNKVENDITHSNKKQTNVRRLIYTSAAVLIILATTVFIIKFYNNSPSTDELFAEYYVFNPSGEIVRGENKIKSVLSKGLIEYDLHNYDKAIKILNQILIKDSLNVKANFYTSMSYIETGKYKQAIAKLETLSTYDDHILIDQIKWYLALCYIKVDDKDKAIKEFSELAESNYYCKNKAKEILEKLK